MNFLLLTTFTEVMQYVGYVLLAILVLLVMITVHEFGHYVSGKILGFGIEEFAIGFGPKIFKKVKKNGEIFSVRILPFGGFCAFKGEDQNSTDEKAFNNKSPWRRIIVLVSGALMNYILAVILIIIMFGAYGQTSLVSYKVLPTSAEYTAEYSLQSRDVILKVDGKNIYLTTDLMSAVSGKTQGEEIPFTVRRNGTNINIKVKLRADASFSNVEDMMTLYSALGIEENGIYSTRVRFGFFETIGRSFEYSFKLAGTIFTVIGQLFTGRLGVSSLGGTVTTVAVTAEAIKTGGLNFLLNIASFIGVNLAVFNLLPFPALDGSRVVFTLIEWIRKKPINRKVESTIHLIGFILIILFAVLVDLQRCF